MDLGLAGKVVLVTGGASGIGAAITHACLSEGARVVILSRATPHTEHFMAELAQQSQPCEFIPLELGDVELCRSAVEAALARHGRIDAVVNNAGLNDRVGLESGSPQQFMESLRNNLLHYYAVTHYALAALKQAQGSVVNIASKVAVSGQGHTSAYAAAKGAQLALTREWAAELLPFGVRVNAVVPAEVMTPLYADWLRSFPDPKAEEGRLTAKVPLAHRMTTPQEIAAAVVFLLSPTQSGHTTGQHLFVDGGYTHLDRALT